MLVRDNDELREEDEGGNLIHTRWRLKMEVEEERGMGIKLIFFFKFKFLGVN